MEDHSRDDWVECKGCGCKPEALFGDYKCEDCIEVISKFGGGDE